MNDFLLSDEPRRFAFPSARSIIVIIIIIRRSTTGMNIGDVHCLGRRKTSGNFVVLASTEFDPCGVSFGVVFDPDFLLAAQM